jgi:hypothetical protein
VLLPELFPVHVETRTLAERVSAAMRALPQRLSKEAHKLVGKALFREASGVAAAGGAVREEWLAARRGQLAAEALAGGAGR